MANPIFDKIIKSLKDLEQLKVVTVVGTTKVAASNADGDELKITVDPKKSKAIESIIHLAAGDITTKIDPDFLSGPLAGMRDFHNQQVTNGREVIATNFKALTDLGEKIGGQIGEYLNSSE